MRSEPGVLRAVALRAVALRAVVLLAVALASCSRRAPPGEGVATAASRNVSAPASSSIEPKSKVLPQTEVTWTYADTPVGPMNAVVVIPEREPGQTFPVLVTFHGTGEARKGP